jgi:hypothetical protein
VKLFLSTAAWNVAYINTAHLLVLDPEDNEMNDIDQSGILHRINPNSRNFEATE